MKFLSNALRVGGAVLLTVSSLALATTADASSRVPTSCPATRVEAGSGNLDRIPAIKSARRGRLTGVLFYAGEMNLLAGEQFQIGVGGMAGAAATKILWRGPSGGSSLRIDGDRLDGVGMFSSNFNEAFAPKGDYPSIVVVPKQGCWRLRLTVGDVKESVVAWAVTCLPASKGQTVATTPRLDCDGARRQVPVTTTPAAPPTTLPAIDATVTTAALRSPRESAPIGANEFPCDAVWADVSSLVPASWAAYTAKPLATRMEEPVDGCELQFYPFGRPFSEGYIAVRVGRACTTQSCESGAGGSATRTVHRSDGIGITISVSRATPHIPVPAALDELLAVLTDVPLPRVLASVIH